MVSALYFKEFYTVNKYDGIKIITVIMTDVYISYVRVTWLDRVFFSMIL